ncbi:two-component system, OmpR family, phosphate regulon response regulator PhoB [Mesorhizobium australicum]|uniref:Two-component system, OmpR family, phosphate regulon response regulator PhoB n=2 Tax=Mesorhizobium australicum TaxID=536018 RepID=A0A1X7NSG1_9HYPH|nr:two-component system, OmpR family, phosphate regulon response regulator PhoB [Mesorhizobium australicum]
MRPRVLIYSKDPDFFLVFGHILGVAGFDSQLLSAENELPRGEAVPLAVVMDCQPGDRTVARLCASFKGSLETRTAAVVGLVAPGASGLHLDLIKAGADEIFSRPFPPEKLLTWLQSRAAAAKTSVESEAGDLVHGDFVLERRSHRILYRGQDIAVPPIEFNLLRSLMARPGAVLSRESLIKAAWPDHAGETDIRGVDVHVARLRKRLTAVIGHDVIRTVRSAGYAFAPDW